MTFQRITIRGNTIEGWMTAAALARRFKSALDVTVVAHADDAMPPPALTSLPSLNDLHTSLGFDVVDLIRACSGTFRLGTIFSTDNGREFVHAFGGTIAAQDGVAFHQIWRRAGMPDDYGAYVLAAQLALAGKGVPDDMQGGFGLHLNGQAYQDYIRRAALHYGATERASDAANTQMTDDLVIDARGSGHSLNAECSEGPTTEDYSATRCHIGPDRIEWHVPLSDRAVSLREILGEHASPAHNMKSSWQDNTIRIGRSVGDFGLIEQPLLRVAQIGIEALFSLFPNQRDSTAARREYNRQTSDAYGQILQFQCLHRALMSDDAATAPDAALRRKIDQFRSRGRIVLYDSESFDTDSHLALYFGYGLHPRRYDPLADRISIEDATRILTRQKSAVTAVVAKTSHQHDLIRLLFAPGRPRRGGS